MIPVIKRKNKAFPVLVIALVLISLTGTQLYARKGGEDKRGPHEHKGGPHPGMCFGDPVFLKEKLKLSEKQIEQIGDINKSYKIKFLDVREKMDPQIIQLKKLLLEDEIDLAKVKSKLEDIAKLKVEVQYLRIKHRIDIEKLLTPEQKKKLRAEKKRPPMKRHTDR